MAQPNVEDPNDYNWILREASRIANDDTGRFVPISSRRDRDLAGHTELGKEGLYCLSKGKYRFKWKEFLLMKDALSIQMYMMLLQELQPAVVFEFGTYNGGSAALFSDLAPNALVVTVDKNAALVHKGLAAYPNILFREGDMRSPSALFSIAELQHWRAKGPWLVIDDAHEFTREIFDFFATHLIEGDYVIVEDTAPNVPKHALPPANPEYEEMGADKLIEFHTIMEKYSDQYCVDTKYTDMFGYNAGWNWSSVLRRSQSRA